MQYIEVRAEFIKRQLDGWLILKKEIL